MVLCGFLEMSKIVIGVAKISVCSSFFFPLSHLFRNFEVSFMVLYGLPEISNTVIGVAKITARYSLSYLISHFFRNFEESFMVLYGFRFSLLALVFQLS